MSTRGPILLPDWPALPPSLVGPPPSLPPVAESTPQPIIVLGVVTALLSVLMLIAAFWITLMFCHGRMRSGRMHAPAWSVMTRIPTITAADADGPPPEQRGAVAASVSEEPPVSVEVVEQEPAVCVRAVGDVGTTVPEGEEQV